MSHSVFLDPASFPPSLAPQPIIAMLVTMAHWAALLLCLQWIYSLVEETKDFPAVRNTYVWNVRGIKFLLLGAMISQVLPRLLMVQLWQQMSGWWRQALSMATWTVSLPTAAFVAVAWWRSRLMRPDERAQAALSFLPIEMLNPQHSGHDGTVKPHEKRRAVVIFVLLFAITFAVTYIRPRQPDVAPSPVAIGIH